MIRHLCIIGVGLIGSSLSLALKKAGIVDRVSGCGRSEENLRKGIQLGVLDDYNLSMQDVVKGADMVVLAVPLGAMRSVFEGIKPGISENTIITDVGQRGQGCQGRAGQARMSVRSGAPHCRY